MSEVKYTQGPWKWNKYTWLDGADGDSVLEYAGCGSHECDVNEANARLIATAPELLEALIDSLCALECCGKDYPAASKARAAIAKALGTENAN